MNKLLISLAMVLLIASCNGPKSGPLVKESFEDKDQTGMMPGTHSPMQPVVVKADIRVEPCEDCITIARLVAEKKSLSGKKIKVKGVVTKVNEAIMEKNWIHIQDGTETDGIFDLTVTSSQVATVGETVTFEGTITLEKDFGYGYFYNILMEEGELIK
jgi:hypothetical protein